MSADQAVSHSISVIVPALNEQDNLVSAVEGVRSVLHEPERRYEILIFDDGSTDRTGELARMLAATYPEIRAIHNKRPQGLGACFKRGVELATGEHVVIIPGDNQVPAAALAAMCAEMHSADIVVPYCINAGIRSRTRQMLSTAFTRLLNGLFGLNLRYYNGPCIHRRRLALAALPKTDGFAYMAVLIIRLVSSGYTVREVGIQLRAREGGRSKAFGLRNMISIGISLAGLFLETRVLHRQWSGPTAVSRNSNPASPNEHGRVDVVVRSNRHP